MIDALGWSSARWAAFMWPTVWDATIVALLSLGVLIPCVRRVSSNLAMAVATVALLKFFVPPAVLAPIAIVDRVAGWLEPTAVVAWFPETWVWPLMLLHVAGVVVMLASLVRQRQSLRRVRLSGRAVTEGTCYEDLCTAAEALSIDTKPALIVTDAVDAPIAIGVRSPAILLPTISTTRLTRNELRLVLAHELAHHKMRDLLGELGLGLATAMWWFHPAVWALAARMRELREERCDALVVRTFTDAETYCRAILAVAATRLPPPSIAMRRHGHPLGRRFERLLTYRDPHRWQKSLAAVLVGVFTVAALPNTPGQDQRADRYSAASVAGAVRDQVRIEEVRRIRIP
ncbi:MAG: M56 family metallopeptidase [Vicinamibacterales bacterium]